MSAPLVHGTRWIELWQSVKRYERDGELLAEMSHTNGAWMAFRPIPAEFSFVHLIVAHADPQVVKQAVELYFQ